MLAEFEDVETRFGADKGADLRKACRYLVRRQFAYSGDRGVATIYNTLTDGRFRTAIDGFFDSLGYRVVRNAEEQWVGILLDDEDLSSVPKLRLDETIVLLVAAGHWQDDADRGDLSDRATSVTTVNGLHERYSDLLQSGGRAVLAPNRFLELLRELEARNIVDIGEFDHDRQDREVAIRSMIRLVSGDAPLRRIEAFVTAEGDPPKAAGYFGWGAGVMELRHLAMLNWHLFDVEDIAIGGHVGILGENRSGKSTILDMIQVVLTGASKTYLRLNAVAGEAGRTRPGSRRSVHGYCLGTLGEGETRREEAVTYLTLGFEDPGGARPPVSIGLAMEARKADATETVYGRFVAVGKILTSTDFVEMRPDGRFPARWDDVKARIAAAVGAGNFHNHRDKAIDYVREYMRCGLVPGLPHNEASAGAMLKAVVNAMTLNHGLTATEFVRGFVLEDNRIQIGELRASIETYKGVNATIVTMRRKLEALWAIGSALDAYAATIGEQALEAWIAKRARWLAARTMNRSHRAKVAAARRSLEADREDLQVLDEVVGEAEREITRLHAAIAAQEARTGRDMLTETLRLLDAEAVRRNDLIDRRQAEARALGAVAGLLGDADAGLPEIEAYRRLAFAPPDAAGNARLREAEDALRAVLPDLASRIAERRRDASVSLRTHEADLRALRATLAQSRESGRGAHLAEATHRLMRRLESAGMDARPLCDIVEIVDPAWVPAAEALLGRDREAIFVERDRIQAATRLFKEGRRDFQGASLVSLNKLEAFREAPRPGTFPAIFRSEDRDALAFLQRRYGNVRLAETLETFNEPGRALMQDGLYDDGLVRSHRAIRPDDHKIGRASQAALAAALMERARTLAASYSEAQALEARLDRSVVAVDGLGDGRPLADLLDAGAAERGRRDDIVVRLAAIEAEGDGGLRDRLRAQGELLRSKKAEKKSIDDRNAGHARDIAIGEHALRGGEAAEGAELNLRLAARLYAAERGRSPYRPGAAAYRARFIPVRPEGAVRMADALEKAARGHARIARGADEAGDALKENLRHQDLGLRRALRNYFSDPAFGASTQVGPESDLLGEIEPWLRLLVADLEGNEIRRHEERAREAAERIRVLVRGEFLNSLNQRINRMERDLAQLNRSLRDHPFHNERYAFHATAEAAFQPILKIVEIGRISDDVLDMLFKSEMPEDFPHRETVRAVERLLEDPEQDVRAFEDYRNYYAFEIHMEDVETGKRTRWETRRGTGSGAEQQVPLYVAIGASLASVFGTARDGPARVRGIAPALFDEAFSKLDGKNQRQMMGFYQSLGLQVVVAAPMEKKAAIMGYIETIVEVDRLGDQSAATVIRLKPMAREALLRLDPDHRTDAEIAAGLAAE